MAKATGNTKHAMEGKMKKIPCQCKHEMQDDLFGKGIRQHNPCGSSEYRCTVCNKVKG